MRQERQPQVVHPFGPRIAVQAREETNSGIILPSVTGGISEGVILELGNEFDDYDDWGIQPGMLVHFRNGDKIGNTTIVFLEDIIAFEELT